MPVRLLLTALLLLNPAFAFASGGKNYVEGEVLVRYRARPLISSSSLLKRMGVTKIRELSGGKAVLVKLPTGEKVENAVSRLARNPEVESVQPNYIYRITSTTPNDTLYSSLWGLKNSGQTLTQGTLGPDSLSDTNNPGISGRDMSLETAWDKITDCSSVTVAVIDTGIRYSHGDLAANMWDGGGSAPNHGWDVYNSDNDPTDDHGHGTHVAGTIGAVGNNGAGTTGVCWSVKLMAIKALGSDGTGSSATVASGIDWAVANGAQVINMSLGSNASDATLEASLEAARVAGVIVVVAAGNDGTSNDATPVYPCNYAKANMICVAALDQYYELASFSNYGAHSVDVAAPGVNIVSTWPFSFSRTTDDFTGWTTSGTADEWGAKTISSHDTLALPKTWDGSSEKYANNLNETAYKAFDLTGSTANKVYLEFGVLNNLGSTTGDSVKAYYGVGSANPTVGILLDTYTGQTGSNSYFLKSYDITNDCNLATCSVGFLFTSDSSGVDTGALILDFNLLELTYSNAAYNVIQGTSMATPHVAGVAAMVKAYQTGYSYLNVVEAVKKGGRSFSSLTYTTSTGKAVDAAGALSYITAPQSITLSKE
jgi:subtilisin family serine protease